MRFEVNDVVAIHFWDTYKNGEWESYMLPEWFSTYPVLDIDEAKQYIREQGPMFCSAVTEVLGGINSSHGADSVVWIHIPYHGNPDCSFCTLVPGDDGWKYWRGLGEESRIGNSYRTDGVFFSNRGIEYRERIAQTLTAVVAQFLADTGYNVDISGTDSDMWFVVVS